MAKNNDTNDLIGFDPLAWMDQEPDDLDEDDGVVLAYSKPVNELADNDENETALMSESLSSDNDDDASAFLSPVHLDSNLNIQNVVELHQKLKKVLVNNDLIEVNAADISSVDTAVLQLFVALKKDAIKQNKIVIFNSPSPRFIESAKLLGLRETLDV